MGSSFSRGGLSGHDRTEARISSVEHGSVLQVRSASFPNTGWLNRRGHGPREGGSGATAVLTVLINRAYVREALLDEVVINDTGLLNVRLKECEDFYLPQTAWSAGKQGALASPSVRE
jgi:hypothetical protein